jgi:polysaccharide export outer membrane protein
VKMNRIALATLLLLLAATGAASARQQKPPANPPAVAQAPATSGTAAAGTRGVQTPADYVIGPEDVLQILFWGDKDQSSEVVVRPDGKITLPLLDDVMAGGLTPEQLKASVTTQARQYIADPNVTVIVKEIKSRKVYITGQVNKPGAYMLTDKMTVLQLIAIAGGVTEFANSKKITIVRPPVQGDPNGKQVMFGFNYKEVLDRKNLKQNIELRPGDTVIVP